VPDQLLNILKLCLLALLYLFFFRVLRAVWAEVAGPRMADVPAARQSRDRRRGSRGQRVLRVVEPADHRGRSYPLADEVTVGRAADCQVNLDDTYVSQMHARVFAKDGQLFVEDLGSTNGTYLNRRKVTGPMVMKRGDRVQVGNTVMELS
jgi:FHA domain